MEREGQTQGVNNWKSGGFCLWAGCNQIWKQTVKLLFYHQCGTLHSLLITEWMSKSGFREGFDCDVNIKSFSRLSLCPGIDMLLWKCCFEIKWRGYWQLLVRGSQHPSATSLHCTPCAVFAMAGITVRCVLSGDWDEVKAPVPIPQHPTMRTISRAQVWVAGASNFCSKRQCFHWLMGGFQVCLKDLVADSGSFGYFSASDLESPSSYMDIIWKMLSWTSFEKPMFHLCCDDTESTLRFWRQISWAAVSLLSKLAIWKVYLELMESHISIHTHVVYKFPFFISSFFKKKQ